MLRRHNAAYERSNQIATSFRNRLAIVVVLLHQGDFVGAEQAYQQFLRCAAATEGFRKRVIVVAVVLVQQV